MRRILLLLCLVGCAPNAVDTTKAKVDNLQGVEIDDVIRELGLPVYKYQLPTSGRWILVYSADRLHKGTVTAALISSFVEGVGNYSADSTGRPRSPHTEVDVKRVTCSFELEFDEALHLASARERGDGC